jgi:hypothetical protein
MIVGSQPESSPVGHLAIADAEDIDPIAVIVKANAIVSNPEAELGRMDAAEALNITGA